MFCTNTCQLNNLCYEDEDENLTGGGDTDNEGIEKVHDDERDSQEHVCNRSKMPGGMITRSGTCETLIELCRFANKHIKI